MFTYIQIIGTGSDVFKGYVDYKITKDTLSMTEVRGARSLRHINIPIDQISNCEIENFYGNDRISFVYQGKEYHLINTGFGESQYLEHRLLHVINA